MSEQVIPEPLSGSEIIDAVVFRVREILRQDCFLNANSAYETVQGAVIVRLLMKDCGREAVVEVQVPVQSGPAVQETDPGVRSEEGARSIEPQPPNQERIETDQPVPVLAQDSTGRREVKRVSYAKPPKAPRLTPAQEVAKGGGLSGGGGAAAGSVSDVNLPAAGPDDPIPEEL